MRIRFTERQGLLLTYLLLIILFLQAQQVAGPYEQALRARLGSSDGSVVIAIK
jgi:hypothetical protein